MRILLPILVVVALVGVWFVVRNRQLRRAKEELALVEEEMAGRESEVARLRRMQILEQERRAKARPPIAAHGRTQSEIDDSHLKYQMLRQQIASRAGAESGKPVDEAAGSLDKDYIKGRVKDLVPLIKECYELARAQQPELSGRMVVEFKISGVPGLGGVVDRAEVMRNGPTPDGGMPPSATLDECMKATVESLTFDPPKGGGTVTVHYPFVFATSDADGGAQ
jgi:hypothetical protein